MTGSIFRLPAGVLTDKFGGKPVFTALLLFCAVPMFLLSQANSYWTFALCSFGFGLVGVSFSIGIAYTSVWFPKNRQGLALGIFGAGNAGSALTTLIAPTLLDRFTEHGQNVEGWRTLPVVYAVALVAMGVVFYAATTNKKPQSAVKTVAQQLEPLKDIRVWRFGLYYFLVFGCFVAFSQWLVPYFVNVYYLPLVMAGFLAALFSFPSGVIRALGGWMSDRFGGRKVMYWVLGLSLGLCAIAGCSKGGAPDSGSTCRKLVPIQEVGFSLLGLGCSSGLKRVAALDQSAARVPMSWMGLLLGSSADIVPPTQTRGSGALPFSSPPRCC